jgi:hypothetical protein
MVWPDGTKAGGYRFHHALYQQVLYEQLGIARRIQLHRQIGARLEAGYGAHTEEIASQLAVHFERGGELERAVDYWQQAADTAAQRNAHADAIAALRKGLVLLASLPERPARTQRELALQLTLGAVEHGEGTNGAGSGRSLYAGLRTVPASGETPWLSRCSGASRCFIASKAVVYRWQVQPGALRPGASPA